MLSPARKMRVCPMRVAGKTGRPSTGFRYHSATSSPAPGALHESLGKPPNLLEGWAPKSLRHGSQNWLATGLLHASEKLASTAKLATSCLSNAGTARPLPAQHIFIFFADNCLATDAFGG